MLKTTIIPHPKSMIPTIISLGVVKITVAPHFSNATNKHFPTSANLLKNTVNMSKKFLI
jgi:hypothetical protein